MLDVGKNTKKDLFWIIPEIVGSVALSIAGAMHLGVVPHPEVIGLWEWIYNVGLCGVVIMFGFKGMFKGLNEFSEVFAKEEVPDNG
jgi:hypothetical protein